jgi:hypothetical protein
MRVWTRSIWSRIGSKCQALVNSMRNLRGIACNPMSPINTKIGCIYLSIKGHFDVTQFRTFQFKKKLLSVSLIRVSFSKKVAKFLKITMITDKSKEFIDKLIIVTR